MTCKRLSRCYVCKRVLPGQARNRPRIRLKCYFFLPFPAGPGIAPSRGGCPAPRNDMLKTGRCARVQGRFPAAPRYCANRRQVFACHCKDALGQKRGTFHPCLEVRKPTRFMDVIARSEATRQSVLFAAAQNEKQHFGRIRKALRICPKDFQFAKFLCGDADCHVAGRLPRSSQ